MNKKLDFILNSESYLKKAAVKEVLKQYLKNNFSLIQKNIPVNFPETPFNRQTFLGAKKRAKIINESNKKIVSIGIESGLTKRFNHLFEEVWCCLILDNKYFFGYSSGFEIPEKIKKRLSKEEHKELMLKLEKTTKISSKDTWGNYSKGLLSRKESLKEAFRNALLNLLITDNFL